MYFYHFYSFQKEQQQNFFFHICNYISSFEIIFTELLYILHEHIINLDMLYTMGLISKKPFEMITIKSNIKRILMNFLLFLFSIVLCILIYFFLFNIVLFFIKKIKLMAGKVLFEKPLALVINNNFRKITKETYNNSVKIFQ